MFIFTFTYIIHFKITKVLYRILNVDTRSPLIFLIDFKVLEELEHEILEDDADEDTSLIHPRTSSLSRSNRRLKQQVSVMSHHSVHSQHSYKDEDHAKIVVSKHSYNFLCQKLFP